MTYYVPNNAPMIPITPPMMQEMVKRSEEEAAKTAPPVAPEAALAEKAVQILTKEAWEKERDAMLADAREAFDEVRAAARDEAEFLHKEIDALHEERNKLETELVDVKTELDAVKNERDALKAVASAPTTPTTTEGVIVSGPKDPPGPDTDGVPGANDVP